MVSKLLVVGTSVGLCAGIQHKDTTNHFLANDDSNNRDNRGSFDLDADISVDIREALEDLAQSVLSPHDVEGQASVHERLRAISGKMDMKTAVKTINHQNLPKDVQALVKTTEETGSAGSFSEESLAKARIALNDLVEKAWVELDDKIIECKEYQEMNRATFDQITTDISRLVEQITDLSRVESESMEGISKMEMEIKSVEEELGKETKIFNVNNAKNTEELTRRQADLDVFQFILVFTKCDDATSLLQKKTAISTNETRICSLQATGQKTMCFSNHEQQSKFNQMMSKSSRTAINRILAEVDADKPKSFFATHGRSGICPIRSTIFGCRAGSCSGPRANCWRGTSTTRICPRPILLRGIRSVLWGTRRGHHVLSGPPRLWSASRQVVFDVGRL